MGIGFATLTTVHAFFISSCGQAMFPSLNMLFPTTEPYGTIVTCSAAILIFGNGGHSIRGDNVSKFTST